MKTSGTQAIGTSAAARHNNPGNIMYSPTSRAVKLFGATKGDPRPKSEGGFFAKFPDLESGIAAAKDLLQQSWFIDKTGLEASKTWIGTGMAHKTFPPEFLTMTVREIRDAGKLDEYLLGIFKGEDPRVYKQIKEILI